MLRKQQYHQNVSETNLTKKHKNTTIKLTKSTMLKTKIVALFENQNQMQRKFNNTVAVKLWLNLLLIQRHCIVNAIRNRLILLT